MRRFMTFAALAAITVSIFSGCGDHADGSVASLQGGPATPPVMDAPTTTMVLQATTTTTIPVTTSTTTLRDALEAAFSVQSTGVVGREYDYDKTMYLGFAYRNLTSQAIAAFQFTATVESTDKLGRSFERRLLFECIDAPIAAGASRKAGNLRSLDALVAGEDNCTVGGWDVNPYISEQIGIYEAIVSGRPSTVTVELNRVVMANGSALGTAVVGRAF